MSKERELLGRAMILIDSAYEGKKALLLCDDIQELLAQPEQEQEPKIEFRGLRSNGDSYCSQEPVAWIETNGKEPSDWEDYEYIWTHWKSGRISLDEAYGCWTWEDITHWMPANIIEPSKPRIDNE